MGLILQILLNVVTILFFSILVYALYNKLKKHKNLIQEIAILKTKNELKQEGI